MLRDQVKLAVIRTDLANERTLLAYVRTSVMMIGSGISIIEFVDNGPAWQTAALGLIALGGVLLIVGLVRFFRCRGDVHRSADDAPV